MEVLSAEAAGNTDRPPILFIHGSLHAAWCWKLFQPFFAEHGYSSYAISLRGAGNTTVDQTENVTIAQHLADLNALLTVLDIERPICIAHSIGGFFAQKWLDEHPALFDALVLLDTVAPSGNDGVTRRMRSRLGLFAMIRITLGFVLKGVNTNLGLCRFVFFTQRKTENVIDEELEGDEQLLEYMRLFREQSSLSLELAELKNPVTGSTSTSMGGRVLAISGADDVLCDEEVLKEVTAMWGGDSVLLPNVPHDSQLCTKWRDVGNSILEWLENLHRNEPEAVFDQSLRDTVDNA